MATHTWLSISSFSLVCTLICSTLAFGQSDDTKHHHKDQQGHKDQGDQTDKKGHAHDSLPGGINWYVTLHGDKGGNSITGLGPDGAVIRSVLADAPDSVGSTKDLRGLVHLGDGSLLVVNAFKDDTRLLRYGPAGPDGVRPFIEVFAGYAPEADPALVHTYSVVVAMDGTIFASDQDTNTVTRFGGIGSTEKGMPIPSPAPLKGLGLLPGVFIPSRAHSPSGLVEVRGLVAMPDGTLGVCDKGAHRVVTYDMATGEISRVLADESKGLKGPIQAVLDAGQTHLYIGDNEAHSIFALNLATGEVTVLAGPGVCPEEPSAMTVRENNLFVGDRKRKTVLKFDLSSPGTAPTEWAKDLPDSPEFLLFASDS